jgi:hypothetical protein
MKSRLDYICQIICSIVQYIGFGKPFLTSTGLGTPTQSEISDAPWPPIPKKRPSVCRSLVFAMRGGHSQLWFQESARNAISMYRTVSTIPSHVRRARVTWDMTTFEVDLDTALFNRCARPTAWLWRFGVIGITRFMGSRQPPGC